MSTPAPGVLSRRSHRRCARIRCAPPVARNATHSSHGAQEKPTSTQNTTLQTMGMDVIKQYPGPLTVSRAVKLAVKLPGKQAQALPAAHRRGAERVVPGHGRRVHGEVRQRLRPLGCTVQRPPTRRTPIELRRSAASAAPSSGSARPPTHPPPTRSMTSTCRCSNVPVFSRMLL